jgi:hypothetical protein
MGWSSGKNVWRQDRKESIFGETTWKKKSRKTKINVARLYSKRDPTYAQCYCLFINLCLLVPQHVSANSYAIIGGGGYYYKLHKMCIKLENGRTVKNVKNFCKILVLVWCYVADFRPGVLKQLRNWRVPPHDNPTHGISYSIYTWNYMP